MNPEIPVSLVLGLIVSGLIIVLFSYFTGVFSSSPSVLPVAETKENQLNFLANLSPPSTNPQASLELQNEINTLRDELSSLNGLSNKATENFNAANGNLKNLQSLMDSSQKLVLERKASLNSVQKKLDASAETLKNLTDGSQSSDPASLLAAAENAKLALENEYTSLEQNKNALLIQKALIDKKMTDLQRKKTVLASQLAQVQAQESAAHEKTQKAINNALAVTSSSVSLKKSIEAVQDAIAAAQKEKVSLGQEIDVLKKTRDDLLGKVKMSKEDADAANKKLTDLESRAKQINLDIVNMQKKISSQTSKLLAVDGKTNAILKNDKMTVQDKIAAVEQQIAIVRKEKNDLDTQVNNNNVDFYNSIFS